MCFGGWCVHPLPLGHTERVVDVVRTRGNALLRYTACFVDAVRMQRANFKKIGFFTIFTELYA